MCGPTVCRDLDVASLDGIDPKLEALFIKKCIRMQVCLPAETARVSKGKPYARHCRHFPQFEGFMMETKTGEVRATLEDPESNDKTRVT